MWSRATLPKKESLRAASFGNKGPVKPPKPAVSLPRVPGIVLWWALAGFKVFIEIGMSTKGSQ